MGKILSETMPLQRRFGRDMQSGNLPAKEPQRRVAVQIVAGKHEHPSSKPGKPPGPDVFMCQRRGNTKAFQVR